MKWLKSSDASPSKTVYPNALVFCSSRRALHWHISTAICIHILLTPNLSIVISRILSRPVHITNMLCWVVHIHAHMSCILSELRQSHFCAGPFICVLCARSHFEHRWPNVIPNTQMKMHKTNVHLQIYHVLSFTCHMSSRPDGTCNLVQLIFTRTYPFHINLVELNSNTRSSLIPHIASSQPQHKVFIHFSSSILDFARFYLCFWDN